MNPSIHMSDSETPLPESLSENSPFGPEHIRDVGINQTLTEIRTGRRLESVVSCIENFLFSQISRLEKGLDACEQAVDNDKIVRKILADFELAKQAWEAERNAETERLKIASEQLAQGWEQLEGERRSLIDNRGEQGNW